MKQKKFKFMLDEVLSTEHVFCTFIWVIKEPYSIATESKEKSINISGMSSAKRNILHSIKEEKLIVYKQKSANTTFRAHFNKNIT